MEAFSEANRVRDGIGEIAEEFRHRGGVFEVTFAVLGEEFARGIEMGVMADAGEDIEDLAAKGFGVKDAVGGEQREMELLGEFGAGAEITVFAAKMMALNFDEDIGGAENLN